MKFKVILAVAGVTLLSFHVHAQRIGWEADFKTRFDNREFTGSSCNESQTIFFADLSTAVTYNWMTNNTLRFGVQMLKDFGDTQGYFSQVRPLMSYAYRAERMGADVGIFSRNELQGDYSPAFFNDSLKVYDPTIQGMALRYRTPQGLKAELALNWEGLYSEYSREKFRVFGSVHNDWRCANHKWTLGTALSVFHFANSALFEGNVVDNMLANPFVGVGSLAEQDLKHGSRVLYYNLRLGMLWAPQRDRITKAGWQAPKGGEFRVRLGWRGLQFENNLYVGENLMPLFSRYGSELYAGERWYGTHDNFYNRTLLGYERSFVRDSIHVKAGMIFHTDGTGLYSQQVLQVSVHLGKTLYNSKNHPRR
jgi:hypothetical protein